VKALPSAGWLVLPLTLFAAVSVAPDSAWADVNADVSAAADAHARETPDNCEVMSPCVCFDGSTSYVECLTPQICALECRSHGGAWSPGMAAAASNGINPPNGVNTVPTFNNSTAVPANQVTPSNQQLNPAQVAVPSPVPVTQPMINPTPNNLNPAQVAVPSPVPVTQPMTSAPHSATTR
jgi:hypothetical protein